MQILVKEAVFEETIQKSKFIAYSFIVNTNDEANNIIKELWKEHRKATHICTAFSVGLKNTISLYDDNGEPSLTAGKPILTEIESKDYKNILVCVVRYFGGIKLGKGGLIRAYSSSAKGVISLSKFDELLDVKRAYIKMDYSSHPKLNNYILKNNILVGEQIYNENVETVLYIKEKEEKEFFNYIKNELYEGVEIINLSKIQIILSSKNKITEVLEA